VSSTATPPTARRPPRRRSCPPRWSARSCSRMAEGGMAEAAKAPGRLARWLPALGSLQGYIGLVMVIALGIATKGDVFLNQTNITNAVGAFGSRGILAVGVTLVILTAGIDLSVGSILGFASMTAALMLTKHNLEI